jgi:hypothetical protein
MTSRVVAIDIGGTKLSTGVVTADGTLLQRCDAPTLPGTDPDALFATLARLLDSLDADGCIAVGVGCGGPMTPGGETVSPLNIPAWRAFPLRARLVEQCGLPVTVDNDAKALALGEGWTGAARGVRDYIGMVVSTGVGGGVGEAHDDPVVTEEASAPRRGRDLVAAGDRVPRPPQRRVGVREHPGPFGHQRTSSLSSAANSSSNAACSEAFSDGSSQLASMPLRTSCFATSGG